MPQFDWGAYDMAHSHHSPSMSDVVRQKQKSFIVCAHLSLDDDKNIKDIVSLLKRMRQRQAAVSRM